MRNTIFAVSFASLLLSPGALGAPVEDAKPAVTPDTPSGVGDPDMVVCRAPRPIAGSDQLGPQVCLHNSEWWKVAMNGKDIAPDGKSLVARATVDNPTGEGDPDAVICRTGKSVAPALRELPINGSNTQVGPEICRTNRFWADVRRRHQIVDARGRVTPRDGTSSWFTPNNGGVGITSQGGDSGMQQSGMPIPSFNNH
jgi:hypothetical protein